MLETVVIVVAGTGSLALLALAFYSARQADLNLQRRVDDAEAGGHPLTPSEQAAVRTRGIRPTRPEKDQVGWYGRYRQRSALTRTQVVFIALIPVYLMAFALVIDLLGVPLGFITMYLLGQLAVGLYVLHRRRSKTAA
jgi:Flp pilus assembly protein TadB